VPVTDSSRDRPSRPSESRQPPLRPSPSQCSRKSRTTPCGRSLASFSSRRNLASWPTPIWYCSASAGSALSASSAPCPSVRRPFFAMSMAVSALQNVHSPFYPVPTLWARNVVVPRFLTDNPDVRVEKHSHRLSDRSVSRATAVLFGFVVLSGPHRFCFMCF
jgi:hypothetical protein